MTAVAATPLSHLTPENLALSIHWNQLKILLGALKQVSGMEAVVGTWQEGFKSCTTPAQKIDLIQRVQVGIDGLIPSTQQHEVDAVVSLCSQTTKPICFVCNRNNPIELDASKDIVYPLLVAEKIHFYVLQNSKLDRVAIREKPKTQTHWMGGNQYVVTGQTFELHTIFAFGPRDSILQQLKKTALHGCVLVVQSNKTQLLKIPSTEGLPAASPPSAAPTTATAASLPGTTGN